MIERRNHGIACKSIAFEYMIPYYHKGRYTTKSVQKIVMRLGIRKAAEGVLDICFLVLS